MINRLFDVLRLVAVLALLMTITGQYAQSDTKAATPLTWTALTLKNGWMNYESGSRVAAAALDPNNIVHLRGAIAAGDPADVRGAEANNQAAFRLPANMRPAGWVYIPVDSCEAAYARIYIGKDGFAYFEGNSAALDCFVSLEGVTFAKDGAGVGNPPVDIRQKKRS